MWFDVKSSCNLNIWCHKHIITYKFLKKLLKTWKPFLTVAKLRSSHSAVFLQKGILKRCRKFTREHPCISMILINLLGNFIEVTFRYGYSAVNLLHFSRAPFLKNTSGGLLLYLAQRVKYSVLFSPSSLISLTSKQLAFEFSSF